MTEKQKKKTLFDYFSEIKDYRRAQWRMHEIPVVLVIVLMAVMSWFTWERAMGDFVKKNTKDLKKYLKPKKNYLPSYQTIDLVLSTIGFEAIIKKLIERMKQEWIEIKEWDQIALDGKWMWWTTKDAHWSRQRFVSLVSAFAVKKWQTVWAIKINNGKESEIPAVEKLVEALWLTWVIYTADALHCQKKTVRKIKETWNHYVIWVKWNQKNLRNEIQNCKKKRPKMERNNRGSQ